MKRKFIILLLLMYSGLALAQSPRDTSVIEVEYAPLKTYFDKWSGAEKVVTSVVPRIFNRKFEREIAKISGDNRFERKIDRVSMLSYERCGSNTIDSIEFELSKIVKTDLKEFNILVVPDEKRTDSYTRMIFHSAKEKTFVILCGIFEL